MSKLTDLVRPLILQKNLVGLTGGGSTKLDGIATVSLALSPVPMCEFIVGTTVYLYALKSGTDAESSPEVIRPDDYATTTNEKVWKLLNKDQILFTIDGGGSTITTGSKGYVRVPCGFTVLGWTVFANASGSIVVDVKRATYSGLPTFSTIAGSAKPTLSSVQKNQTTTLTGWTTALAEGDWLEFNVDSVATVQRVVIALFGLRG